VIARLHEAGGIASLAHPVLLRHDEWIADLSAMGLDAIEVYHSKHDDVATARYLNLAASLGIGVSGGSDFHGHESHGPDRPGAIALPSAAYQQLVQLKAIVARSGAASAATSRQ
jgi:predicted metal-dependent phosphoesterase TrpH